MESKTTNCNQPKLRRFLAIGLTVLSLLFLFWPSIISISEGSYGISSIEDTFNNLYEDGFGWSKADARAAANAVWAGQSVKFRTNIHPSYSVLDLRDAYSAASTVCALDNKYEKKEWEERNKNNLPLSMNDNNGNRVNIYSYNDYQKYMMANNENYKKQKQIDSFNGAMAVLLNIVFFAMLAAGIAAIVLYAMNLSRIPGFVLAALTVATDIIVIIMMAVIKKQGTGFTAIGPAMILLPASAIAACFLYQPEKKEKRAKAPRAPRPARVTDSGTPFEESAGYVPPVKPTENPFETAQRTAPRSGVRFSQPSRPADNPFAEASRPAPVNASGFCRQCGQQIKPGSSFCPFCGGKQ